MNDGMSIELQFVFYAAAVVCFVLAALGSRVRAQVGFLPLGLALFVFPTMWNTGVAAFWPGDAPGTALAGRANTATALILEAWASSSSAMKTVKRVGTASATLTEPAEVRGAKQDCRILLGCVNGPHTECRVKRSEVGRGPDAERRGELPLVEENFL